MSEFWTETKGRETDWKYYEGPNGLLRDVRENGGRINIRYYVFFPIPSVIGIGTTEQEAIEDWLRDAMKKAEEAERELNALREAIVVMIRKLKGE